MARASWNVPNFTGGQWSQRAQGRLDDARYKTALNLCFNSFPVEEGSWVRRPCWQFVGTTHQGLPGRLFSIPYQGNGKALLEFTSSLVGASQMRIWVPPNNGTLGPVMGNEAPYTLYCDAYDSLASFTTAAPARIVTTAAHAGWATGDTVVLFTNLGKTLAVRQFAVTKINNTTYDLYDPITGFGIDGTQPEFGAGVAFVGHVVLFGASYTDQTMVKALRIVTTDGLVFVLHHAVAPFMLKVSFATGVPVYTFQNAEMGYLDGPYIDPFIGASQTGNATASVAVNGLNWNFTLTDAAYLFINADANRAIRAWNQPPAYNAGTSYNNGDQITYNNAFWKLGKSGVPAGTAPGQSYVSSGVAYTPWVLNPSAGYWAYGSIISRTSDTVAVVNFNTPPNVNGSLIDTYQLGLYTAGQYPTCGTWCDGRLWLAGALTNRIDGSISGVSALNFPSPTGAPSLVPPFAPTDKFGSVLDNSAIAETIASPERNDIYWLAPDEQGIVMGAAGGEWLLSASTNDEVLTPTNVKVRQKTKFACANIEPVRTGPSLIFVQGSLFKLYEYLTDAFTQRFTGKPLNLFALDLTGSGVAELAYQEDSTPILWARDQAGILRGCTYRRVSRWATEPPQTYGWHYHFHGAGTQKRFESICAASRGLNPFFTSIAGITTDDLYDATKKRYVEVLTRLNGVEQVPAPLYSAYCDETIAAFYGGDNAVDGAGVPIVGSGPGPGGGTSTAGKYYFEVKLEHTAQSTHGSLLIGVASLHLKSVGTGFQRDDPNIAVMTRYGTSAAIISGVEYTGGGAPAYSDGDTVGIAVDTINKLIWFKNVTTATSWNGGAGDPSLGTGGYTTSGINTDTGLFIFFGGNGYLGTDQVLLNSAGTFLGPVPTGFSAWGAVTWSTPGGASINFGSSSQNLVTSTGGRDAAITQTVGTDSNNLSTTRPARTIVWYNGRAYINFAPADDSAPSVSAAWDNAWIGAFGTGGKTQ